jgi:hypothetical protein
MIIVTNTTTRAVLTAALLTIAPGIGGSPVSSVGQSPSASQVRLRLVSPPVELKAPVFINAILSNPTDAKISEIRQRLAFPRAQLRFMRARLGIAGEAAGAVLNVEMQDASGVRVEDREKAEQLAVTITATKPLPGGPLAEFEFRPVTAKEQSLRVRHTADAVDLEGEPVPSLAFSDVHVTVTRDPGMKPLKVFSCFFYMH